MTIAEDLVKRKDTLAKAVENGAVILSVCGGYQLLGRYYKPHEGPELKGISLVDAYTVAGDRQISQRHRQKRRRKHFGWL